MTRAQRLKAHLSLNPILNILWLQEVLDFRSVDTCSKKPSDTIELSWSRGVLDLGSDYGVRVTKIV